MIFYRNTNQPEWIRLGQPGYSVRFSIIGGTTFPRFLLKLALTHPQPKQNITLRAVFPVYGDDAHKYHRDLLNITPGRAIESESEIRNSLNPDGSFTLSNAMKNLKYQKMTVSNQDQVNKSGIKMNSEIEEICFDSDIEPSCSRFNDDLKAFTQAQRNAAAIFRKIKAPETKLIIASGRATNHLQLHLKVIIAMPSPVLPPFPLVDARYNPRLKCLKPIHISNIEPLESEQSGLVIQQYALRTNNWDKEVGLGKSMVTNQNKRIIPLDYSAWFENKRHYEAVQMLALAREVQAQQPDKAALFNRQYGFQLIPVPTSDGTEFLIFINVRPTCKDRHDTEMVPPEPGTKVNITIQRGIPNPKQSTPGHHRQISGVSIAPQHRSHASSIASQRIPAASGRASGPGSPASQRSRPLSDVEMSNISELVLPSTPGALSTWTGPTIDRESDIETWNGLVVPSPQKGLDEFEICVYLRIASAGGPLGGLTAGYKYGDFKFGLINKGPFAQAEQAIRLAMHGDGIFYGIPARNWVQDLLFGNENRSLRDQGHGNPSPNVLIHPMFKNKPLTQRQRQALDAALTNTHPVTSQTNRRGDRANHFALLIQGPPGTGKSTVSKCIAYHCYGRGERLLITCGTNQALNHLAGQVLELVPTSSQQWTVKGSAIGVYCMDTEFDEDFHQIERNAQAYQHEFKGDYEAHNVSWDIGPEIGVHIDDATFSQVEQYVKRRIHTNRPLSLGDHILVRLKKARNERFKQNWTQDLYQQQESQVKYGLLWKFIGLRNLAKKHDISFVDILGESQPQRQIRLEELTQIQRDITRETTKAWRNLQAFYIKHAKIVFVTAQTAGRRILKSFRAQRVIIEEAGQLDEANSVNAFIRSFSTLRKVIWTGDPAQLPPSVLGYNRNEAAKYRATSQMERLIQTGLDFIQLDVQFRMSPGISKFISQEFYGNTVTDHVSVQGRKNADVFCAWVQEYCRENGKEMPHPSSSFFISVNGSKVYRRKQATSPCNPAYIERTHDAVMNFLHCVCRYSKRQHLSELAGLGLRVAVACYYTEELSLFKKWFHEIENLSAVVDVVTVDSTQGSEWDIVFLSTTRPGGQYGLGFVTDPKRMNVSLSRAKHGHVTIGNKDMGKPHSGQQQNFEKKTHWQNYWDYHQRTVGCFLEVQAGFSKAAKVLNVNPEDYELMTGGATSAT